MTADRALRFHHGNAGIDETLDGNDLGSTWVDLVDAVRDNDASAFDDAIDDLKALVSFTWSTGWTDAVREALKDAIHPA